MTLTGTIGADWLRKHGVTSPIADETLRAWRDFLEARLLEELKLDADFAIGESTFFRFTQPNLDHTIVEIESFTRRALDAYLDKETRSS
ncbi:MAG TPA: hypothetical protein VFH95_11600 [Candidatus Kapabacteria bacterium]|nr:hypothetical protein [Candidatus Kapabacteria bacterium]